MDAHLSALGLQPQPSIGHRGQETDHMASSIMPSVEIAENQDSEESDWGQQGLWLGNWLSFNQQMMGVLDHNDFAILTEFSGLISIRTYVYAVNRLFTFCA